MRLPPLGVMMLALVLAVVAFPVLNCGDEGTENDTAAKNSPAAAEPAKKAPAAVSKRDRRCAHPAGCQTRSRSS